LRDGAVRLQQVGDTAAAPGLGEEDMARLKDLFIRFGEFNFVK